MKRALVGIALLAAAAGAWLAFGACHVDGSVTKPVEHPDLALDDIRAMLRSGDFKQKLEASRQIDKLPPDERLRVLEGLAADPDPAARLLAVKKLKSMDDPRAKAALEKLKSDADPDVRALAGS